MKKAQGGFTLIELLVVISIISLLIAILLPALAKARESAVNVQCQTLVRTLGTASLMYTGDNKGNLHTGSNWRNYLRQYEIKPGQRDDVVTHSIPCPKFVPYDDASKVYNGFGFNRNIERKKIDSFKAPLSKMALYWDDEMLSHNHSGGYPANTWHNGGSWYRLSFRHNNALNIVVLDGHVTALSGSTSLKAGGSSAYLTSRDFYNDIYWETGLY